MSATTRIALKALALSASTLAMMQAAPAMAQVEEIIVTAQRVSENPDHRAGVAPAGSALDAPNNAFTATHNKEPPCHSR